MTKYILVCWCKSHSIFLFTILIDKYPYLESPPITYVLLNQHQTLVFQICAGRFCAIRQSVISRQSQRSLFCGCGGMPLVIIFIHKKLISLPLSKLHKHIDTQVSAYMCVYAFRQSSSESANTARAIRHDWAHLASANGHRSNKWRTRDIFIERTCVSGCKLCTGAALAKIKTLHSRACGMCTSTSLHGRTPFCASTSLSGSSSLDYRKTQDALCGAAIRVGNCVRVKHKLH